MRKFIGNIDSVPALHGNFTNFRPLYEIKGGEAYEFSDNERSELLPKSLLGNICFWGKEDYFVEDQLLIFDFEFSDLEANDNNKTAYKVPANYNSNIKDLWEEGAYRIIDKEDIDGRYDSLNSINVEYDGVFDKDQVLIKIDNNKYIGPYEVEYNDYKNRLIINTDIRKNKFILEGYQFSSDKVVEIVYGTNVWNIVLDLKDKTKFQIDVATDEDLILNIEELMNNEEHKNNTNIEAMLNDEKNSLFVDAKIGDEIKINRLEKIRTLMTDEENFQTTFKYITKIIATLLIKYQNEEETKSVFQYILDKEEFKNRLVQVEALQDITEKLKDEIIILRQEKKEIEDKYKNVETIDKVHINGEILLEGKQKEYDALCEKVKFKLEELEEIENLEDIRKEVKFKERRQNELNLQINKIEEGFKQSLIDTQKQVTDVVIDEYLANMLIDESNKWNQKKNKEKNHIAITKYNGIDTNKENDKDIKKYLCNTVKMERPTYNENMILNIFICITQNMLTVFAGNPGTGKTSICNIVAKTLGLSKAKRESNSRVSKYVKVSVERGWTSKRDLVGYYNPITKTFDESNKQVFDLLTLADFEKKNKINNLMNMVLLDEANLSPMEYYWADFMNICDDNYENNTINLGEEYIMEIPESFKFVATINNDHTTETLSPRLIDRSWVITLPKVKEIGKTKIISDKDVEYISWDKLEKLFGESNEKCNASIKENKIYKDILKLFNKYHNVSNRSEISIRKYFSVASELFEYEDSITPPTTVAIDYILLQKLMPMIDGNGEEYLDSFLNEMLKLCNDSNLTKSKEKLLEIIKKGKQNMNYFQFF